MSDDQKITNFLWFAVVSFCIRPANKKPRRFRRGSGFDEGGWT